MADRWFGFENEFDIALLACLVVLETVLVRLDGKLVVGFLECVEDLVGLCCVAADDRQSAQVFAIVSGGPDCLVPVHEFLAMVPLQLHEGAGQALDVCLAQLLLLSAFEQLFNLVVYFVVEFFAPYRAFGDLDCIQPETFGPRAGAVPFGSVVARDHALDVRVKLLDFVAFQAFEFCIA